MNFELPYSGIHSLEHEGLKCSLGLFWASDFDARILRLKFLRFSIKQTRCRFTGVMDTPASILEHSLPSIKTRRKDVILSYNSISHFQLTVLVRSGSKNSKFSNDNFECKSLISFWFVDHLWIIFEHFNLNFRLWRLSNGHLSKRLKWIKSSLNLFRETVRLKAFMASLIGRPFGSRKSFEVYKSTFPDLKSSFILISKQFDFEMQNLESKAQNWDFEV